MLKSAGVVLAHDGRAVFAGGIDPRTVVRRWDVATGRVTKEYGELQRFEARYLAVSAGGRRLVAVNIDGTMRLWDVVTARECWRLNSRGVENVRSAVFSPDGSWVATEGRDSGLEIVIDIWDARTGTRMASLRGHRGGVTRMAFSPDSKRLASASRDGTALIWDVEAATGRRALNLLDPMRQAELWADLSGGDGVGAHAIDCLQAAPTAAVTILKQRLQPAVAIPTDRITPLLAAFDGPTFAVREKAQCELAALGVGAEPALRAGRDKASVESRRRIDAVLANWEGELRRLQRSVEVLEQIATPGSARAFDVVGRQHKGAALTRAAKEALARLPK